MTGIRTLAEEPVRQSGTTRPSPRLSSQNEGLTPINTAPLGPDEVLRLIEGVLTEQQRVQLEDSNALHFSFGVRGFLRFKACAFLQRGTVAATFRPLPFEIPQMPRALAVLAIASTEPPHSSSSPSRIRSRICTRTCNRGWSRSSWTATCRAPMH